MTRMARRKKHRSPEAFASRLFVAPQAFDFSNLEIRGKAAAPSERLAPVAPANG